MPDPNWKDVLRYDGRYPEPPYDEPDDEPIGSCDDCGSNVYTSDYGDGTLCDECEWKREQS